MGTTGTPALGTADRLPVGVRVAGVLRGVECARGWGACGRVRRVLAKLGRNKPRVTTWSSRTDIHGGSDELDRDEPHTDRKRTGKPGKDRGCSQIGRAHV